MYCKHCGKQIADDSTFCQYCGGKVDAPSVDSQEDTNVQGEPAAEANKPAQTAQEVVITNKEDSALQVEISKKSVDNSPTIANEIVGNLKMICLAFGMFAVYMFCFILDHQKDIKEYDYPNSSYFAESGWEKRYYNQLYFNVYGHQPFSFESPSPEQCLENAKALEKQLKYSETDIEYWKNQAKEYAKKDEENRIDEINRERKWRYKEDMKKNAKYASIICLLLCIFGRYLIKLTKWVDKNKTE